jgi:hypothetical protein
MDERFSRRLADLGIPHRQKPLHGTCSLDVVREALSLVIEHTREVFRAATR